MARSQPPRRDSPIEYRGDAHLVTVTCTECGDSFQVPESTAAASQPTTCRGCTHECVDGGHLEPTPEAAPARHLARYRCTVCGQRWTFDIRSGDHSRGVEEAAR